MVAFNRRFDPNFARLEREIRAGRIGRPESLSTHRWREMGSNHRFRAKRTGRHCYGLELDPAYVDTAIRRWQARTGDSARPQTSGRKFDDLADEVAADHAI